VWFSDVAAHNYNLDTLVRSEFRVRMARLFGGANERENA
jgi:hypothetical protein